MRNTSEIWDITVRRIEERCRVLEQSLAREDIKGLNSRLFELKMKVRIAKIRCLMDELTKEDQIESDENKSESEPELELDSEEEEIQPKPKVSKKEENRLAIDNPVDSLIPSCFEAEKAPYTRLCLRFNRCKDDKCPYLHDPNYASKCAFGDTCRKIVKIGESTYLNKEDQKCCCYMHGGENPDKLSKRVRSWGVMAMLKKAGATSLEVLNEKRLNLLE